MNRIENITITLTLFVTALITSCGQSTGVEYTTMVPDSRRVEYADAVAGFVKAGMSMTDAQGLALGLYEEPVIGIAYRDCENQVVAFIPEWDLDDDQQGLVDRWKSESIKTHGDAATQASLANATNSRERTLERRIARLERRIEEALYMLRTDADPQTRIDLVLARLAE